MKSNFLAGSGRGLSGFASGMYDVSMAFNFPHIEPWPMVPSTDWNSWSWQFKNSLKTREQFAAHFSLSFEEEEGFAVRSKNLLLMRSFAKIALDSLM